MEVLGAAADFNIGSPVGGELRKRIVVEVFVIRRF
jgi:hypothetical protein